MSTYRNSLKRAGALTLALVMVLGSLGAVGAALALTASADAISDSAPKGTVNVARGATVTASLCSANRAGSINSYEMPSEGWCLANLTNGSLADGWSTNPYDKETNRNAPVTLTMQLDTASTICAVALFPHGAFPEAYTVSVSEDGTHYTQVAESKGNPATPSAPNVHTFAETRAAYIRIDISVRSKKVTNDGALAQFGEIAVYGKQDVTLTLDRPALELEVGETDQLTPVFSGAPDDQTVTWKSDNTAVVSVDADGKLTAKKVGTATVTATNAANGLSVTCPVTVVEKHFDLDDNIMISIFWPPTPDYITDEQYKLIADAGVNWIMGAGEETLATPANQQKVLALAAKYGLRVIVNDGSFGGGLASKDEATIIAQANKYKNVPGVGGFYILDEPMNANGFVNAYTALKKAFPEGVMHLNFLPSGCYGSEEIYKAQMNDWCRLCEANGYPVDYLIYDRYPFGLQKGSMDRVGFYTNMRSAHDVALENGVRTGTYIQTVCQSVAFRRPTDSEIRYEMYSALAFGFKQLSFFTWFTPVNRSEPFEDGIISADGVPNAHYETIKTINHEILAIGSILAKCEAEEIYLNGTDTYGQPAIPADFFVQAGKSNMSFTVSLLRHKETGRNYLMVVNNNFSKAQDISLVFDDAVKSLSEVSRTDGSLIPLTMDGQTLNLSMEAGDGMLIALPEGVNFVKKTGGQPEASVNLAEGAIITASESVGADGYYTYFLSDGIRLSDGAVNGWRSTSRSGATLTIDLGESLTFNRMDLYPTGSVFDYGETFPQEIKISVSDNGTDWKEIKTVSGMAIEDTAPTVTFDAVTARYIRIEIVKSAKSFSSLCEIEIYNDDGSVPKPQSFSVMNGGDEVITYTEGEDIAKNKNAYASSTTPDGTYKQWGWSLDYINDGDTVNNGWTSNVKVNNSPDSTEYVIIDFGDLFAVEKVVVTAHGCFPEIYKVQLSTDGKNWTNIAQVKNAPQPANGEQITYDISNEPVTGRYLRFYATRLRPSTQDGYLLQLGNISAYGKPVCDTTVLTDAIDTFRKAGGEESEQAYTDAVAALENPFLTQTQANAFAAALLSLVKLPETETETVPETDPGTTTEPETAPETASESGTGTEPVVTNSSTESETAGNKTSGCSSTVGTAALVGIATAAVAVIRKKKKDSASETD